MSHDEPRDRFTRTWQEKFFETASPIADVTDLRSWDRALSSDDLRMVDGSTSLRCVDLTGPDVPRSDERGAWRYPVGSGAFHLYDAPGPPVCGQGPEMDPNGESKTPGGPWCATCYETWKARAAG